MCIQKLLGHNASIQGFARQRFVLHQTSMSRNHLLSYFGSPDPEDGYAARQQFLHQSAAEFGAIDVQHPFGQAALKQTAFYQQHQAVLDSERGAGFWLWKPYLILQLLEEIPANDYLMYHDVGRALSRTPGIGYQFRRPVTPLVEWADSHGGMFPGVYTPEYGPASRWTRRDCFVYMDCDARKYWSVPLVQAGINVWKNTAEVRGFIGRWLEYCTDPRILTDQANECGLDNLPDFKDHRHDQSVLTNLIVRENIAVFNRVDEALFKHRDVDYLSRHVAVSTLLNGNSTAGQPNLEAIAAGGDKTPIVQNETSCYQLHMEERRHEDVSLLEISNRRSNRIDQWHAYLPRSKIIMSYPGALPAHLATERSDRAKLYSLNPAHRPSLELFCRRLATNGEKFDYVIVSGAELMRDQQLAIAVLFPMLKPGGHLFIEGIESARKDAGAAAATDLDPGGKNSTLNVIRRINIPTYRYSSPYFGLDQVRYMEANADTAGVHWSPDYRSGVAVIRRRN